jgi:transcriptional regulator GlxA family with amidase domain
MAWVDLGLKLVDRFLGPTVMLETAQFSSMCRAGSSVSTQTFRPSRIMATDPYSRFSSGFIAHREGSRIA